MEILLEIVVPKIQWKEPSPPKGHNLVETFVNIKDKYNEMRQCYYSSTGQSHCYKIFIPNRENHSIFPSEDVNDINILNTNKIAILKNHGIYTLKLEFYGMKPKYHGANVSWLKNEYIYTGSFKEDEEEISKPYLKEYSGLSHEKLFLLLNKIVKAFQINENILIQDFASDYFRATNGPEMVNAIMNYIFIKMEYGRSTINNNNVMC